MRARRTVAAAMLILAACSSDRSSLGGSPSTTAVSATTTATTVGPATTTVATGAGTVGSVATTSATPSTAGTGGATRPNVLFILTDDMRFDDLQYMPHVRQLIADQGMTFDNEFDNVTLCCPARTSILRGQYSHNTGVLTNDATNGGFETAHRTNIEQSTIATAMQSAGYSTGLFGKYLNGYPDTVDPSYVPPGWNAWSSSTKGNAYSEYNYTLNQNGTQVAYGKTRKDYGTDVYFQQATDFIGQAAKSAKPFFVYLAVYAPHQPATPARGDLQLFPGLQAPRDPSYNEADVSDKPQYIRDRPLLTAKQQTQIDALNRRRAQSLQAVDRDVAALIGQLQTSGQLANTDIIFTSDNGFHLGQHRLPAGKQTAYETDIHLPLLIRGPGIAAGAHVSAITGNIDLAPTIAALGGTTLTDKPDGRSLVAFLTTAPAAGGVPAPQAWRVAYLLEHWTSTSVATPRPGAGELEPDDMDQGATVDTGDGTTDTSTTVAAPAKPAGVSIPEFQGLRTATYTYVEYSTGERELYNVVKDPNELDNLARAANPMLISALHQRLSDLRSCSADECRTIESQPLNLPPGS